MIRALFAPLTPAEEPKAERERVAPKSKPPLRIIHGGTGTRLYDIWRTMRARCRNPRDHKYPNYGGRGITICEEWSDFANFRDWALANGYADDLTIDRRDNDGNYEPGNCRWIPHADQALNRSTNQRAPSGELWCEIAFRNGIPGSAYWSRISRGWPYEQAVSWPVGRRRPKAQRASR